MAEADGQEKTEDPTGKKLSDARNKGQVTRSKDLGTAAILIMASFILIMLGDSLGHAFVIMMTDAFTFEREAVFDPSQMMVVFATGIAEMVLPTLAILIALFIAAVVGTIALGGMNFSTEAMMPKFSKMSPLAGFKRMFGTQGVVELLKSILKVAVIGCGVWGILHFSFADILVLSSTPFPSSAEAALDMLLWMFLILCMSLLVIVVVDVPYQIWHQKEQLKMTKQEVKDEHKDQDGKPEVKGRIRRLQMEAAQRRMMGEVPDADVIVTNPTHYSVAIKYDPSKGGAPMVVAKGVDQIALKIREIAREYEVPVMSSPQLCRAIYHTTELDREIPHELFVAVAQILAYIFQLEQFRKGRGKRPTPLPKEFDMPQGFKY
ncbi:MULTISPECIES: flagellar biosynthesis protein FlhB [unclassified Motilimonas]|uniref:flagellar biosynthesis protein FlhB n=1 Tax=unclassified Motilimonas TaxID=2643697 RepID=UPI001E5973EE|nr:MULTISPECIES: flagellar biosynthesis protein FlhB [unclassified Motilimonas]MCE0556249.1 flagellar biosynthesis protein FlhB [Motilimonas sp. E26]MDO6524989.1 flagellar biosynthesis protein FlhB [Motilimonas sp. 1_MG-2023]